MGMFVCEARTRPDGITKVMPGDRHRCHHRVATLTIVLVHLGTTGGPRSCLCRMNPH